MTTNVQIKPEGYAVVHTPSTFILRHYLDVKKAVLMSQYLNSLSPEKDILFSDELFRRAFHLMYEKIFVRFFVSGVRTEREIEGFIYHNQSICTTADISKNTVEYLLKIAKNKEYTGTIFLDSGAFGEVNADLSIKKAMTDEDWQKIFDLYEVLGKAYGSRLTVMSPDRVGDQEVTMQRLEKYKDRLKKVASYGCKIMGAIQKNPTIPNSLFLFHERMNNFFESIGVPDWVRGLPLNKSPVGIVDVEYMIKNAKPFKYLHLLGKSPYAKDWDSWEKMLSQFTNLDITCDATIFRRMVGEGKALTELENEVRPLFEGDFKRIEDDVYADMMRDFDAGDYSDYSSWYTSQWFSHDEVKEALVESLKSNKIKRMPMPKDWLLTGNNLTKVAFLDVNLSLPYGLFGYVDNLGITAEELEELEYEDEHKYWDTIMKLYEYHTYDDDFELPYETYGTYFMGGHRDGYSLFPDEYRQAIKLDAFFDILGKSVRTLAVKLLNKEERGFKEGRLVSNPLVLGSGIMRER